jgi:hypothetical protein
MLPSPRQLSVITVRVWSGPGLGSMLIIRVLVIIMEACNIFTVTFKQLLIATISRYAQSSITSLFVISHFNFENEMKNDILLCLL